VVLWVGSGLVVADSAAVTAQKKTTAARVIKDTFAVEVDWAMDSARQQEAKKE